jgi:hypothetical protein
LIVAPSDWTRQWRGETLVITAPQGAGIVVYDERVRPVGSVLDLIKAAPPPNGFAPATIGPIREIVTHEGEYGARVDVEGRLEDKPATLCFGFVVFEDFYSRTLGLITEPASSFRTTFDELVRGDTHILGASRRRRFRYDPPAGWREARRLFESTWFDPRSTRSLHVGPAIPNARGLADTILAGVLGGGDPAERIRAPGSSLFTTHGLTGMWWRLRFADRDSDIVILEDDRFTYCARLDVRDAATAADDVLATVVDSIRPIPRTSEATSTAPFMHWAD